MRGAVSHRTDIVLTESMESANSEHFYNTLELMNKMVKICLGEGGTAITGGYGKMGLSTANAIIFSRMYMAISGGYDYNRRIWGLNGTRHARAITTGPSRSNC
jgi:hypothetical protein